MFFLCLLRVRFRLFFWQISDMIFQQEDEIMKRFNLFFIIICIALLPLSGCQLIGNTIGALVAPLADFIPIRKQATEAKIEISQKIVDCFNEKDTESIVNILCKKTQEIADIKEQIRKGFEFVKGNIVSYDKEFEAAGEGQSTEYGETLEFDNGWTINDVTTDIGEVYTIYVHMFVLDTDKNREGVSNFSITDKSDAERAIGYRWTKYDYDGITLAHNAVKAISDEDLNGLKALFCAKSLENNDIENQMQSGFKFFEGKATFGEVKGQPGTFDGNHDFRSEVKDEEIIENYKPVQTYISVFCENIETDTNKIYTLELYAYLLNIDNQAYQGISQIIIREGTYECVIGEKLK